jgi:hypothetical protein
LIKQGALSADELFTNNWLGRAREYREMGEQLDIVNWYYRNKHVTNKPGECHYVNGLFISEYVYRSGLQAAVARVDFALRELERVAAQPLSEPIRDIAGVKQGMTEASVGAQQAVRELQAALAAVIKAGEAVRDAARKESAAGGKAGGGDAASKHKAPQPGQGRTEKAAGGQQVALDPAGLLWGAVGTVLGKLNPALASMFAKAEKQALQKVLKDAQQEVAAKVAALETSIAAVEDATGLVEELVKRVQAGAAQGPAAAGWADGIAFEDDDAALDKQVKRAAGKEQAGGAGQEGGVEGQSAKWNGAKQDDVTSAKKAKKCAQDKRAAVGMEELARWAGWRVQELRASAEVVVKAANGVEAAADAVVPAQEEDMDAMLAAAGKAEKALATAAGDEYERERVQDNSCRPGRFQLIQKQELKLSKTLGEAKTSLTLARRLKFLGSKEDAIAFQSDVNNWPEEMKDLLLPTVSLLSFSCCLAWCGCHRGPWYAIEWLDVVTSWCLASSVGTDTMYGWHCSCHQAHGAACSASRRVPCVFVTGLVSGVSPPGCPKGTSSWM